MQPFQLEHSYPFRGENNSFEISLISFSSRFMLKTLTEASLRNYIEEKKWAQHQASESSSIECTEWGSWGVLCRARSWTDGPDGSILTWDILGFCN